VDHNTVAAQQRPGQRAWRDLSKRRLLFGLAFAPVPPIALGAFILLILGAGLLFTSLWPVLSAAEIWSMLVGTLFLLFARRRGFVRRAHCLLLGAFLAFSLPAASLATSKAIDWMTSTTPVQADEEFEFEHDFLGVSDGTLVFVVGVFLIPFGTLGGWVFWRIGVYPARPKLVHVATVFD